MAIKIAGCRRINSERLIAVFAALMVTFLISCKGQRTDNHEASSQAADSLLIEHRTDQQLTVTQSNQDTLLTATVHQGNLPDSILLNVDHPNQQIHLQIKDVQGIDSIVAQLTVPGEQRNLRFNQIKLPDGRLDGPFGLQLRYPASASGEYTLIIGRDNMADGTVQGPVIIHLQLLKHS